MSSTRCANKFCERESPRTMLKAVEEFAGPITVEFALGWSSPKILVCGGVVLPPLQERMPEAKIKKTNPNEKKIFNNEFINLS